MRPALTIITTCLILTVNQVFTLKCRIYVMGIYFLSAKGMWFPAVRQIYVPTAEQ